MTRHRLREMQRAKLDPMDETVVGSGELRAILFDLGGVVIDIDFKRAFQIWAALASVDASDLEKRFTFDEAYEQHETGDLQSSAYFNALGERLNVSLSEDDLVAGWNDIYLGAIPGNASRYMRSRIRIPLISLSGRFGLPPSCRPSRRSMSRPSWEFESLIPGRSRSSPSEWVFRHRRYSSSTIPLRMSTVQFQQECGEWWLSRRETSRRLLAGMASKLKLDTTSTRVN